MSSEIGLPNEFKETLREKILSVFMGLIPVEKIDELVTKEIQVFFETEVILLIEETKIVIDNPQYKPGVYNNHNNEKKLNLPAVVFGTKMTPFRQLVWSTLHQHLQPKIKEMLDDIKTEAGKELQDTLTDQFKPQLGDTFKAIFTQTAKSMSAVMLHKQMEYALNASYANMINAMTVGGFATNTFPSVPLYNKTPNVL